MEYSLVKFKGKSGQSNYLVLTKDVKGFNPRSVLDITDTEYMVKWQDSFHDGVADVHHNGCYPATVLLVGATPEELRAKAKELKIKFPSKLPLPECPDEKAQRMNKPLKRRRHQQTDIGLRDGAKKLRMKETEEFLETLQTSSSPKKSSSGSRAKSSKKSGSHRHHHPSRPKSLSADNEAAASSSKFEKRTSVERSQSVTISKTHEGNNLGAAGHHHSSRSKSISADNVLSPSKFEKQTSVEKSQFRNHSKTNLEVNHSVELGTSEMKPGNGLPSSQERSAQDILRQNCDKQSFKKTPPVVKKSPKFKKDSGSDTERVTSDEDDATVLLDQLTKKHNECIVKIETLEQTKKKMEARIQTLEQEDTKNKLTEMEHLKKIAELKAANFTLHMKLKSVSGEDRSSSPAVSEDAVTSVLSFPTSSASPFSMMKESSDPMFDFSPLGSGKLSAVKEDKGKRKGSELKKVSKQLFKENDDAKKNLSSNLFSGGSSSESSTSETQDQYKAPGSKATTTPRHSSNIKEVNGNSIKKEVSASQGEDEFGSGLDGVSKRIEADLRGITPLQGDTKKVNVGMGLKINRNAWEKSIRMKGDDSKFLKESAGLIWGREALQSRTGFRQTATKKACTPKKVALLHAMLKGKMNARDEGTRQQNFILENMAPKWLTAKCYDSGRKPKPKPVP